MTAPSRLRAVPRLVGRTGFDYRFDVASQVMAAGTQDVLVQPIVPLSFPAPDLTSTSNMHSEALTKGLGGHESANDTTAGVLSTDW